MSKRIFDLDDTENRENYKLLSGLIVPRPIGWIGTRRDDDSYNLAPFSFFNVIAANPPTVIFSAGRHPDRPKDSVAFAEQTGEFSVNVVSEETAAAMNVTSGTFTADDDEFAIAGLTAVTGIKIDAPMVAESPANLECRVVTILDLGERSRAVVGEVVAVPCAGHGRRQEAFWSSAGDHQRPLRLGICRGSVSLGCDGVWSG